MSENFKDKAGKYNLVGIVKTMEPTTFSVELTAIGPNKISVIKAVREITSLQLGEAKFLVESVPQILREGISKDESNEIKEKLVNAGATVSVKGTN